MKQSEAALLWASICLIIGPPLLGPQATPENDKRVRDSIRAATASRLVIVPRARRGCRTQPRKGPDS